MSMLRSSNAAASTTLYGTHYGPGSSTNIVLNLGMEKEGRGLSSSKASLGGPLRKHLATNQANNNMAMASTFRN